MVRPMATRRQRTERLPTTGLDAVVANLIACGTQATANAAPWCGCRTNTP